MPIEADPKLNLVDAETVEQSVKSALSATLKHAEDMIEFARREPETAVHQFRKSLRRCRALLRMVDDADVGFERRYANKRLRNAARSASALRDADVLPPILESLRDWPLPDGVEIVSSSLRGPTRRPDRAHKHLSGHSKPLAKVHKWADSAFPADLSYLDLLSGLAVGYDRGRKLRDLAELTSAPDHIHEWRKRTKETRYQLELLARPKTITNRVRQGFGELAESLGRVTDLLILRDHIVQLDELGGKNQAEWLRFLTDRIDVALQSSFDLAEPLLELEPSDWAAELEVDADRFRT